MSSSETIEITAPIVSRIKTGHRDDGTPKATCQLLSPISWVKDNLRFTLSPWVNGDGEIVNTVHVTPVETSSHAESVLDHFAAGSVEPKPKPASKGKSKGTAAVG